MVLSAEQERVRSLIADTVSLLCKNGLHYTKEFSIEGLLGITLDHDEVFLVNIKEIVKTEMSKDYLESGSGSEESTNPNPSSRRRRRKRQRKNTGDGVESDSDNEMNSSVHGGRDNSSKKNIKLEDNDSGDDLVFVKNEPGLNHSNNFSSNFSGLSGATSATNDILGDLSQQGQLYATPTSNPLPSPSWDPHHSTNSLYNTPNHQQAMNVMSPTASPGGSMQHMGQQQALQHLMMEKRVKRIKDMDSETYGWIVELVEGTFKVPVSARTVKQKSAVVRFYRNREHLTVQDGTLFFNGDPVQINNYQLYHQQQQEQQMTQPGAAD